MQSLILQQLVQLEIEMEVEKGGVGKLVSATSRLGRGGLKGLEGLGG